MFGVSTLLQGVNRCGAIHGVELALDPHGHVQDLHERGG
jgi:hypothetical protein